MGWDASWAGVGSRGLCRACGVYGSGYRGVRGADIDCNTGKINTCNTLVRLSGLLQYKLQKTCSKPPFLGWIGVYLGGGVAGINKLEAISSMKDINKIIEDILLKSIFDARSYVKETSLRESVEAYKDNLLKATEEMKLQNNPEYDWAIEQNLSTISFLYAEFLESLKDEKQQQKVIEEMINNFDNLNHDAITIDLENKLQAALPKLKLVEEYSSMHGIFFEYDSSPVFGIIAFPEQNFEVVIDPPKYVSFENGDYASKTVPSIDFSSVAKPLFSDSYDEVIWAYENELEFFVRLNEMYMNLVFLCLNRALQHNEILELMKSLPITSNAIFYGGQHDCEVRTIFVRQ